MTEENDLLIIGNGFDIACGLKSSYQDFFNARYNNSVSKYCNDILNKYECAYEEYRRTFESKLFSELLKKNIIAVTYDIINSKCGFENMYLNKWDFVFLISELLLSNDIKDILWYDVENIIYEVISILYADNYEDRLEFIKDTDLKDKLWVGGWKDSDVDELFYAQHNNDSGISANRKSVSSALYKECIRKIFSKDIKNPEVISPEDALNELYKFEIMFSSYIISLQFLSDEQGMVTHNDKYMGAYISLLSKIICENTNKLYNVDILNFNYTPKTNFYINIKNININKINNIHGQAKDSEIDQIIFGIGDNEIVKSTEFQNDKRIIFTKGFRLLTYDDEERKNIDFLPAWDKIKIYGHSLGEADYSYFISIFDKCDLYNSNVQLVFYYYDDGSESTLLSFYKKVYDLITSYGLTNSNPYGSHIMKNVLVKNLSSRMSKAVQCL